MTARKKPERYRAKHAFGVSYEGEQITVSEGEVVRAGHPLLVQLGDEAVEEHFEPFDSFGRFDVETATAEPEVRKVSPRS